MTIEELFVVGEFVWWDPACPDTRVCVYDAENMQTEYAVRYGEKLFVTDLKDCGRGFYDIVALWEDKLVTLMVSEERVDRWTRWDHEF